MACFHRWLALHAATSGCKEDDWVCLLDTDFLIGMAPEELAEICTDRAGNRKLNLIAECGEKSVGPEITIIRKGILSDFCSFIACDYFSEASKRDHARIFMEIVGRGETGGISDMTALAAFAEQATNCVFNLNELEEPMIIGNINDWIKQEDLDNIKRSDWAIEARSSGQYLIQGDKRKRLVGIHFQGSAKPLMNLVSNSQHHSQMISKEMCILFLREKEIEEKNEASKKSIMTKLSRLLTNALRQ